MTASRPSSQSRSGGATITIDVYLTPEDVAATLPDDVRTGLGASPKWLPPKWFYDDRGSQLFDEITRLPEYYPTRAERAALRQRAPEIARVTGADTLVELGSGTSEKTRVLLDALDAAGTLERFVPFDVSEATLRNAADEILAAYDDLSVHGVVGDFHRHLDRLPRGGRRLVAFLGSTIGNLVPNERSALLRAVASGLGEDDAFLLGIDLVKDPDRLVAAYDDAAGVTAMFNKNVLSVVNSELGGDFDLDRFEHVAVWRPDKEWIEMRLRSLGDQRVTIDRLDLTVDFADGEELRTEISAKFRRDGVETELGAAGLSVSRWWTDPDGDVALVLAVPA